MYLLIFVAGLLTCAAAAENSKRPHIICILADDMGWNDVGFHGSNQIPTPNIDAMAFSGILLNRHYVLPICTPSRVALMTGKYPFRTGMQGYPIMAAEPRGLPRGKIMPQYFKDLGYATHAIGKWHLGYHELEFTPTYRGFDSFFGYWNGFVGYYDYILQVPNGNETLNGFDLRRNLTTAWEYSGRYATDVFAEEAIDVIRKHNKKTPLFLYLSHLAVHSGNSGTMLEAPQEWTDRFSYITDPNRRTYAAMVAKLDESIGRVVQSLQQQRMLDNSIIVFLADNGAPTVGEYSNWGSNWPLRGVKETLWEGGVRGAALLWSPLLKQRQRVSTSLMHVSDWLPTLYAAAGGTGHGQVLDEDMDGINQWQCLAYNRNCSRNDVLLNFDEIAGTAAFISGKWKVTSGTVYNGTIDGYYGDGWRRFLEPNYNPKTVIHSPAGRAITEVLGRKSLTAASITRLRKSARVICPEKRISNCNPKMYELCLFDIKSDPCELNDLSKLHPQVVKRLERAIKQYTRFGIPQANTEEDLDGANPARWNNTWSPWVYCESTRDPAVCNV